MNGTALPFLAAAFLVQASPPGPAAAPQVEDQFLAVCVPDDPMGRAGLPPDTAGQLILAARFRSDGRAEGLTEHHPYRPGKPPVPPSSLPGVRELSALSAGLAARAWYTPARATVRFPSPRVRVLGDPSAGDDVWAILVLGPCDAVGGPPVVATWPLTRALRPKAPPVPGRKELLAGLEATALPIGDRIVGVRPVQGDVLEVATRWSSESGKYEPRFALALVDGSLRPLSAGHDRLLHSVHAAVGDEMLAAVSYHDPPAVEWFATDGRAPAPLMGVAGYALPFEHPDDLPPEPLSGVQQGVFLVWLGPGASFRSQRIDLLCDGSCW